MKLIHGVSLAGVVLGSVLSVGFVTPAEAATQADCTTSTTGPVNTDGGNHYAAVCAQGVYVQGNELASAPGGNTFATVKTGQAPVDALLPVFAVPQPTARCTPKPGDVVVLYTDNFQHYAGICAKGAELELFEVGAAPMGPPIARIKTGQAPVDALLPTLALPIPHQTSQCTAGADDLVVIYTDALQHVLGACDASGDNIKVGEVMGAVKDRNHLVDADTAFLGVEFQTQAEGGTNGAVIHPKLVITPGKKKK